MLVADIVADLVVCELQVVVFDRGGVREYVGVPVFVFVFAVVFEGLVVAVDVLEDVLVAVVVRVMRGVTVCLAEFENEGEEELVFDAPVEREFVLLAVGVLDCLVETVFVGEALVVFELLTLPVVVREINGDRVDL